MEKYKWDINKIKSYYSEVQRIIEHTQDKSILAYLKDCLNLYSHLISIYYDKSVNSDCLEEDEIEEAKINRGAIKREVINAKDWYSKKLRTFCTSAIATFIDKCNEMDFPKEKSPYIDIEDSIKLSKDFYKSLNPELYEKVNGVLLPRRNLLHTINHPNSGAVCYLDEYRTEPYIFLVNQSDIASAVNLTHELAHAAEFMLNGFDYESAPIEIFNLCEVASTFSELAFFDYLKTKGFDEETININKKINFFSMIDSCYVVLEIFNLAKHSYRRSNHFIKKSAFDLDDDENIQDNMHYFLSMLVALGLYEQYKADKQYGAYNLMNFIKHPKTDDLEEILYDCDIALGATPQYVDNYIKSL